MTDFTVAIQAEILRQMNRLRTDLLRRAPWASTIDEPQFVPNVRTGPQTTHSTRKLATGNGVALTAEPSDSTASIPFKILPEEAQAIILGLRESLREAQDKDKPDLHHSVEVLTRLVLALCHMALDEPGMTAEERAHRLKADEGFRKRREEMHVYEVGGGYEPRRKERFNEEVHADLKRTIEKAE